MVGSTLGRRRTFARRSGRYVRRPKRRLHRRGARARRFGMPSSMPTLRHLASPARDPDAEVMRMVSRAYFRYSANALASRDPNVGVSDGANALGASLQFDMQNIYVPGFLGSALVGVMPAVTGFTEMNLKYSYWQSSGLRVTCKIHQLTTPGSGTPQQAVMNWMLVAMPDSEGTNLTTNSATTAWNRLRQFPHHSKLGTTAQDQYPGFVSSAPGSDCVLSLFTSGRAVSGFADYYVYSNTYGSGVSVLPTSSARVFLLGNHEAAYVTSLPDFDIEVTLTHSVRWFGIRLPTLSVEPPRPDQISEPASEVEFDAVPEYKSVSEPPKPTLPKCPPPPSPAPVRPPAPVPRGWLG